jgi:protein TonB
MLAYAAHRRSSGPARSPRALILILAGHVLAIAAVMSARMDLPAKILPEPIEVTLIPDPPPPEPQPQPERRATPDDSRSSVVPMPPLVPIPSAEPLPFDRAPLVADPTPVVGDSVVPQPRALPDPPRAIVRKAARFVTPADDIRPPYPESKSREEAEAVLRLALTIDPRGRVTAVDPVGPADAVFLDAARRHILRYWRYQPASEDGSAVASRITVTLAFEIER